HGVSPYRRGGVEVTGNSSDSLPEVGGSNPPATRGPSHSQSVQGSKKLHDSTADSSPNLEGWGVGWRGKHSELLHPPIPHHSPVLNRMATNLSRVFLYLVPI